MKSKKLVCENCEKATESIRICKYVQVKGNPIKVCPTCSARLERSYGNLSKKLAGFLGI